MQKTKWCFYDGEVYKLYSRMYISAYFYSKSQAELSHQATCDAHFLLLWYVDAAFIKKLKNNHIFPYLLCPFFISVFFALCLSFLDCSWDLHNQYLNLHNTCLLFPSNNTMKKETLLRHTHTADNESTTNPHFMKLYYFYMWEHRNMLGCCCFFKNHVTADFQHKISAL